MVDNRHGSKAPAHPATAKLARLRAEFDRTDLARHLASFHRTASERRLIGAAFIEAGLRTDHRCLYLIDESSMAAVKASLRGIGIDVTGRIDSGDLAIRTADEVYLDGGFDPDRMVETMVDESGRSQADGYAGLWAIGENSWRGSANVPIDDVLAYEIDFDRICPNRSITALCQYHVDQLDRPSTVKVLLAHRQMIYREQIIENPYYRPPSRVDDGDPESASTRLLLDQLVDLEAARRAVDRREERLDVINRILRHNIRNDLNVITGILSSLANGDAVKPARTEDLQTAIEYAENVVSMADKARFVHRGGDGSSIRPIDLDGVLSSVVASVTREYPTAEITIRGKRDLSVLSGPHLEIGLTEAVTNAVVHQEAEPPRVSVAIIVPDERTVTLRIANPGPSIPECDREVIQRGWESALDHGSGLGLWLIKWIVENAHGEIRIPEPDSNTAVLEIDLHRADPVHPAE